MSGKKAKKARRIARRVIAAQWRTDLDFLQSLPFRSRLGICLNIMFRFGYKRVKHEKKDKVRKGTRRRQGSSDTHTRTSRVQRRSAVQPSGMLFAPYPSMRKLR